MNTCRGPTQAACPPAAGRKAAEFAASQQEARRLVIPNGKDLIQRLVPTGPGALGPQAKFARVEYRQRDGLSCPASFQ
jgi:hypothetical protein